MERSQSARAAALALLVWFAAGCSNPFAPALRGDAGTIWSDAQEVGGLLENFVTAYELKDSLRYAELLDESFQFSYFDLELQRQDGWFRESDLRSTARLFRAYDRISLIWSGIPTETLGLSTPDSLIEFRAQYQLVLDNLSPLIGFARFTVMKPADDRFRVLVWQEEF
ncbi:MAG: hypothetical protein H6506_02385 [Calditrichaeota bacterium]|nr:hypothetical protein [Calditrichota bacterium]MCB9391482.1 hypothetical protein [Calditrichota bacterium]